MGIVLGVHKSLRSSPKTTQILQTNQANRTPSLRFQRSPSVWRHCPAAPGSRRVVDMLIGRCQQKKMEKMDALDFL